MRPALLPSLLLVLLTAVSFWPARTATFLLYDDPLHVTENPYILPPTPARLAYFWRYPFDRNPVPGVASSVGQTQPPYQAIYSPLAFTVWGLLVYPARMAPLPTPNDSLAQSAQQSNFSLDPSIYHSFNLGLHVLNVLLVFALLRHFVRQEWAAALGAALFAVHPVQVEPVAWVTGMNNLLSGFFALAALLLFLSHRDTSDKARWKEGAYWGSVFCFLLSVLSKPSSVTLPVLALIFCWGLGETRWRLRLLEMVPWAIVALFCLSANALVARGIDYGLKPMSWQKPFLVGDALTFYMGKLLLPIHLAPDYGRRPEWVMGQPLTYGMWLVPLGVGLAVWLWWKRSFKAGHDYLARIALTGLALFIVVLLPSSGIVTYYFHRISTVSDRYMYLALLGPAIMVAVLTSRCAGWESIFRRRVLALSSLALVATATFLSFRQTQFWRSDSALWSHNIALNPLSTVAYFQAGSALYNKGDYRMAITTLEQGLRVSPNDWLLQLALGDSYFQVQEYTKSESHYLRTLKIWPNAVYAHLGLGVLLAREGDMNGAVEHLGKGLQIQPQNPLLLGYMGLNLMELGKSAEAIVYLRNALEYGFDPAKGHFYLGNALAREGDIDGAVKEWDSTLQFDPSHYEACFNLGIAAAGAGNTVQALRLFQRTVKIQPDYAPAQAQLGLQWQKLGQLEKARIAFRAALQSDPQNSLALSALKIIK